jgi:hypothetical protein
MGADVTLFVKNKKTKNIKEVYYRDSYNDTNLAWIAKLSYWKNGNKNRVAFMKKVAQITDEQIKQTLKIKYTKSRKIGLKCLLKNEICYKNCLRKA